MARQRLAGRRYRTGCIIGEVKRIGLVAAALLLAACARKNIENKDAIRQAVVEYLSANQAKTGLDMSAMDVDVTAMTFERDTARATVAFKVKNGDAGMQFNYTLDRQGDKWVVKPNPDAAAHGAALPGNTMPGNNDSGTDPLPAGQLPPGHPAIPPSSSKQ